MREDAIEQALLLAGYTALPFSFNGAGHPIVSAKLSNGAECRILLDTGASANLLDKEFALEQGFTLVDIGEKGGGAGGMTIDLFSIQELGLELAGLNYAFQDFLAMDFATIKDSLLSKGLEADFHGILGFGFFKRSACFFDYAAERIFIK